MGRTNQSAAGRGFLAGTAKPAEDYAEGDYRRNDPRFQGENFAANMRAADALRAIADRKLVKPGQIALAWLLRKGDDIVPIPGIKRRSDLEENVAAADITLSPDEVARMEQALHREAVAGPRYAQAQMAIIDRRSRYRMLIAATRRP